MRKLAEDLNRRAAILEDARKVSHPLLSTMSNVSIYMQAIICQAESQARLASEKQDEVGSYEFETLDVSPYLSTL